jgi:alkanesulfonate monooxygenase SsuD/methylene tetrahydromethanopterin reductase-like flavin-dependent oxidoreductase (luciferase family)
MRLGLGPIGLNLMTRARLVSLAARAVASSFDAVWLAEARAQGVGGGLAAAAMVAQAVPIRVGAAVDAGLYHPLHLAEDIAIADLTSQGRIEVLLRLETEASARYGTPTKRGWFEEHVEVLAAALSGAHIQWSGEHLRVPARIGANQPAPERLALNPRPAQPVVPIWLEATETWMGELAHRLGFGVAVPWIRGGSVPAASGRWPGMLMCPATVDPHDLLSASGEGAGYFLVAAETAEEVAAAGRRLSGRLRMPDFPAWIEQQQ